MALSIPAPAALLVAQASMVLENPRPDDVTPLAAFLKRSWPCLAAVLAISAVLAIFYSTLVIDVATGAGSGCLVVRFDGSPASRIL